MANGIERDTLTRFTNGAGVTAFTGTGDSDVIALPSIPLEEYRITWGARPNVASAITAIDAQLLGSLDGSVFDIVLAEIKDTDTASQPTHPAWDSTNGETVQNIKAYVKYLKVHIVSITVAGGGGKSVSFPIIIN
jgi:hypothetical protein